MKKFVCLLAAVLLVLAGCTSNPEQESEQTATSLKAGTYEGTAMGFHDQIKVQVVIDETSIVSVEVLEHAETRFISDLAINQLPKDIVDNQSWNVDVYSGCTVSSNAVINAVKSALSGAGDLTAFEKAPEAAKIQEETRDTDVVVVGGGIAGLSAAITAKENGAEVILVEKLDRVGGSTVESGGILYATGSPINQEQDNDVDALVEYWQNRAEGKADETMLKIAAEGSAETVSKLMEWGVQFSDTVAAAGTSPALRAHYATNSEANGEATDGVDFIVPLLEHAEEIGIEILTSTTATELLSENGTVNGIKAEGKTANYTIHAKSVILATGGFDLNQEMMQAYSPEMAGTWAISSVGNTGDGISMAESVGAKPNLPAASLDLKLLMSPGIISKESTCWAGLGS